MSAPSNPATLERPNGSHWIATAHQSGGAISKEELFPVVTLDLPRIGRVRARFEVSRYTFSDGEWSEWRVILRDLREWSEEEYNGADVNVTDARRECVYSQAEPLIREWLESDAYAEARRRAAAAMVARVVVDGGTKSYGIDNARRELARHRSEIAEVDAERLARALDALDEASRALDELNA